MKEKEIIEFTKFDDYYEKNNILEFFRLPFELLKDKSPLDLIDNNYLPKTGGLKLDDDNISAHTFYSDKLLYYSRLKREYLNLFNSLSKEKIDFSALMEANLKEMQASHLIQQEKAFNIASKKYITSLIANGELEYKVLLNKDKSYLRPEEKALYQNAKERYMHESMPSMETAETVYGQTIPLTHNQNQSFYNDVLPRYYITTIKIFTNYEDGKFILNKILNEDYLKLQELQKNALTLETFRSKVKYHYAHMKDNGEQYSLIEVVDKDNGLVKLSDDSHFFMIHFSPKIISKIMPKIWYGPNMELDEYAGLIAINPNGLLDYRFGKGYCNNISYDYGDGRGRQYELLPQQNIGYVFKPENAMLNLFNKKLAIIEDLEKGILNIRTSDLDLNGYKCQLPTQFILELSQKSIKEEQPQKKTQKSEKEGHQQQIEQHEKMIQDLQLYTWLTMKTIQKVYPTEFNQVLNEMQINLSTVGAISSTETSITSEVQVSGLPITENTVDLLGTNINEES